MFIREIIILIKPESILNNKMPLIYSNDYILYVNNDSYKMELTTVNWMDNITMKLGNMDKYSNNSDSTIYFNLYMHTVDNMKILIGKLQDLTISDLNKKSIFNGSLNNFDPVKYKIAKAYSFGGANKKSTRLAICLSDNLAITNVFTSPRDKTSIIILFFIKLFTIFL